MQVGKHHIGFSTECHTPTKRGFDSFYGFYNGGADYWTKRAGSSGDGASYLDVQANLSVVEAQRDDNTTYSADLWQGAAERAIRGHAARSSQQPLFLYYAMQNVHGPIQVSETATLSACLPACF